MRPLSIYSAQKFNKNSFFKKRLALHKDLSFYQNMMYGRCEGKNTKWGTVGNPGLGILFFAPSHILSLLGNLPCFSSAYNVLSLLLSFYENFCFSQ